MNERQYSTRRAFVVQFGRRSDTFCGQFAGRVEHVASGKAGHFDAAEELLAFFSRVLLEEDRNPTQP